MVRQIIEVQTEKPIKERILEKAATIQTQKGVIPIELLRKEFQPNEQLALTTALAELRVEELLEPTRTAAITYHPSGFVLDIQYAPAYRLTGKGERALYLFATGNR